MALLTITSTEISFDDVPYQNGIVLHEPISQVASLAIAKTKALGICDRSYIMNPNRIIEVTILVGNPDEGNQLFTCNTDSGSSRFYKDIKN